MRTQPQTVIQQLEADNSRLSKEQILDMAAKEGLVEFFEGLRMALDGLYTFGVKQVPISKQDGQGLSWDNFLELADSLRRRQLTGHAAKDRINREHTQVQINTPILTAYNLVLYAIRSS